MVNKMENYYEELGNEDLAFKRLGVYNELQIHLSKKHMAMVDDLIALEFEAGRRLEREASL